MLIKKFIISISHGVTVWDQDDLQKKRIVPSEGEFVMLMMFEVN